MNEAVRAAALDLVARAKALGYYAPLRSTSSPAPRAASAEEVAALQNDLGGRLPDWYMELLTTIPLGGLRFEYVSDDDLRCALWWNDFANLRFDCLKGWPGKPLIERGYICIAWVTETDDGLFVSLDEDDDPLVHYIGYVLNVRGNDADTLLAERETFAPSLSALLRDAIVTEQYDSRI